MGYLGDFMSIKSKIHNLINLIKTKDINFLTKVKFMELKLLGRFASPYCYNLPSKIAIELTNKCNFNCDYCVRRSMLFKESTMSVADATKIINSIPQSVKQVFLFGVGEPLMYPIDDLVYLINLVAERGFFVSFVTNGSLLTKSISDKLMKSKLSELRISIDSPDPKIFYKIRNYDLNKIKKNLKYFCQNGEIPVMVESVLTDDTAETLYDMVDFVTSVGAKKLNVQVLKTFDDINQVFDSKNDTKTQLLIEHLKQRSKINDIVFYTSFSRTAEKSSNCYDIFAYQNINVYGRITHCSLLLLENDGPKFDGNLAQLWNSKYMAEYRQRIIKRDFPNTCKKYCGMV